MNDHDAWLAERPYRVTGYLNGERQWQLAFRTVRSARGALADHRPGTVSPPTDRVELVKALDVRVADPEPAPEEKT